MKKIRHALRGLHALRDAAALVACLACAFAAASIDDPAPAVALAPCRGMSDDPAAAPPCRGMSDDTAGNDATLPLFLSQRWSTP